NHLDFGPDPGRIPPPQDGLDLLRIRFYRVWIRLPLRVSYLRPWRERTMPEPKDQIVSSIVKARAELEVALFELEKLPAISQGSVFFAAHALNNFLTVTGGTVELLSQSLADHPDPKVR